MLDGKQTCSERSMYDFLLPEGIKDLINVIYFLAQQSVMKVPIIRKIENKFHVYLSYQKKSFSLGLELRVNF